MALQRTEESNSRQYDAWAGIYDNTFGRLVRKRQRRAVAELDAKAGERVLDLGVGTGLTLPHYAKGVRVVGIDLSDGMLREADERVKKLGLDHIDLIRADAMHTPFADQSFDHILITHVISVVSNPERLLDEAARLLKPDGRIVVLNHFRSDKKLIAAIETMVNPLCMRIGWRSDLGTECMREHQGLRIDRQLQLTKIDLWKIFVLSKSPAASASSAHPADGDAIQAASSA